MIGQYHFIFSGDAQQIDFLYHMNFILFISYCLKVNIPLNQVVMIYNTQPASNRITTLFILNSK